MIAALFPNHIGRVSFAKRFAVWLIFTSVFEALILPRLQELCKLPPGNDLFAGLFLGSLLVLTTYYWLGILIPRVRDIGAPSLTLLLFCVPIVSVLPAIAVFFAPTDWWHAIQSAHPSQKGQNTSETNPSIAHDRREDPY